jgi:hypothetical protein
MNNKGSGGENSGIETGSLEMMLYQPGNVSFIFHDEN